MNTFLIEHSVYVVLIIAAIILLGVLYFISRVDARLRRLEHKHRLNDNRN